MNSIFVAKYQKRHFKWVRQAADNPMGAWSCCECDWRGVPVRDDEGFVVTGHGASRDSALRSLVKGRGTSLALNPGAALLGAP